MDRIDDEVTDYERALSPFLGHDLPGWYDDQLWTFKGLPLREMPKHQTLLAASVLDYHLHECSMHLVPPGTLYGPGEQWLIYLVDSETGSMLAPTRQAAERVMSGLVAHDALRLVGFGGVPNGFGETLDDFGVRDLTHRMDNGRCTGFGAMSESAGTWLVYGLVDGAPFAESLTSRPVAQARLRELMRGTDPLPRVDPAAWWTAQIVAELAAHRILATEHLHDGVPTALQITAGDGSRLLVSAAGTVPYPPDHKTWSATLHTPAGERYCIFRYHPHRDDSAVIAMGGAALHLALLTQALRHGDLSWGRQATDPNAAR